MSNAQSVLYIQDLYNGWFLDYASYVILERAIPNIEDGLKPVQRRILHAMNDMNDGRYNKVANIIGQSMQYHPHGDASIGEAIINIGQKELLIDTQGNWGDIRTGDAAAAARYIESRLSKFALDVLFNDNTTKWGLSYDGRKKEPVTLPVKFPLLLSQGAEGIAVGLSTKILPHNFIEIINAAIKYLKNKSFTLYPDFQTGGFIDVSEYNDGKKGGKIKNRAIIEELDKKTLIIKSVPYGVTTTQLCDSIVKANDQGKIKIKKVIDNTAKEVEIVVELMPGISTDVSIHGLYAFTDCEISISPNMCVIENDKPIFTNVSDLLKKSVERTKALLLQELNISLAQLQESWHYSSLEKIFIENKIYRKIEDQETWEGVLNIIDKSLTPFKDLFKREITQNDIIKLTEIQIKRISKFDIKKADEEIKKIEKDIKQTKSFINNLTDYTISYYEELLKKYSKGKERKTEIKTFDKIETQLITIANTKMYANKQEGFIGTGLKKDELLFNCSDLDDIIVFRKDGKMLVTKVAEKTFVGKDIIHIDIFKKNDERTTYHLIYVDGNSGITFVKRFNVTGITRDKEYDLIKTHPKSRVIYFSAHPNGEEEMVSITLSPSCAAHKKLFEYNFNEIEIKNKNVLGNQLTKYPIKSVKQLKVGLSTLAGRTIWYDDRNGRLTYQSDNEEFLKLGVFNPNDYILTIYNDGQYEIITQELTNLIDNEKLLLIEKFNPNAIISCLYYDKDKKQFWGKRFLIETTSIKTPFSFLRDSSQQLELVTTNKKPIVEVRLGKKSNIVSEKIDIEKTIEVASYKNLGIKLLDSKDAYFNLL